MLKRCCLRFFLAGGVALFLIFCINLRSQVDKESLENIKKEVGRDIVQRESYEAKADARVRAANKAYQKNEFKNAIDNYLKAISFLRECGKSEYIQRKVETCDRAISNAYFYWSEKIARKAEKMMMAQKYDEAIKHCQEAMKIYPPSKKRMQEYIKKLRKMKQTVAYRKETSEDTVDPGKKDRNYKIDVLIKQGEAFYKNHQYDKARDKLEEALVINPYSMTAINDLRKVNLKILESGKRRSKATRNERLAETEWKMITPIVPRTITGSTEKQATPVDKEGVTDKIHEKLRNIIIDHIEFDEVTIPTVVKYLKQRSKQIDPEKIGVNIFLRLSKGPEAPDGVGASEESEDDDWEGDDDADDEGDDEGDDDGDDDGDDEGDDEGDGEGYGEDTAEVPTVTMVVDEIPLGDAISYICRAANLKHRVEKYAVVIASNDVPLDEVETKIYPLDSEAIDSIGEDSDEVRKYFESRGIVFPAGSKIVYDNRISRLIATNTPENLRKIEEIIHSELNAIDPQVLIQTKFVEIAQNDLDELGFEYYFSRPVAQVTHDASGTPTGATGLVTPTGTPTKAGGTPLSWHDVPNTRAKTWDVNDPIMRNVYNNGIGDTASATPDRAFRYSRVNSKNMKFDMIVHALDQADTADVLSSPRVTTMNGEEATIRMITEKYYPESWGEATIAQATSQSGDTTSVFVPSIPEFGDPTEEGIILRVTPNVDADRYTITLDMNPVVQERVGWTDFSYAVTIDTGTYQNVIRMPEIEARTIQTSVTIYDGETIVLGGIIKDTTNTINDIIPILGEIPLVGRLFQTQAKESQKTNLLIFLTCRLVNPDGSPIRERELRGLPAFRQ